MTLMNGRVSDAARFDEAFRHEVLRVRRAFLDRSLDGEEAALVGSEIIHSWRRSWRSGVDPADTSLPAVDLCEPRAQRLARAAEPVMRNLAEQCRDSECWGLLLDRDCVQVYPFVGDARLVEEGERRGASIGAVYHESTVGTNGASISLERLEPYMVVGAEHFRESEHNLVSVGVPLRDALGRLAGMFLMCHRLGRVNHLLAPFARQVGEAINREIAARADRDERVLFEEYSRHSSRPSLPTVAMSDQVFVANAAAQQQLRDPAHLDVLRATIVDVAAGGKSRVVTLELGEKRFRVHCRVVGLSPWRFGVVATLSQAEDARPRSGRDASPQSRRLCALGQARARGLPVLLVGERGSGRTRLARSFTSVTELDADVATVDPAGWLGRLRDALDDGQVLIRGLDVLDPGTRTAALALVRSCGRWSLATSGSAGMDGVDAVFPVVIECPSLRSRKPEFGRLIPELLAELGETAARCTPEAMSVLVGYDWPGNVSQLRRVLASALLASHSGDIGIEHLPRDIVAPGRGSMSEMARVEREMVFEALRKAEWNREAAAEALGISRATMYRKIKQFSFQVPSSRRGPASSPVTRPRRGRR